MAMSSEEKFEYWLDIIQTQEVFAWLLTLKP
jgi:hypothetical protein